jgi:hypothetical protein
VLTLTPYDFWRHSHALHHANSGNLDHRGFGDVDTLTVREFLIPIASDEQKTGRRSKSGIVIFSFVATPQRKTRPSTRRRGLAFRYFRCRHSDAAPDGKSVVRRRSGSSYFAQSLDGQGRTLSKQYANANQARLN